MKKLPLLLAALLLLAILSPVSLAASRAEISAANSLYELGVFNGTSTNSDGTPVFELDRAMTRAEGVAMLVRLLGCEAEALSGSWETPFTDVPPWAAPYVGCAYKRGLTNGVSETLFGSDQKLTAGQYAIFLLRALGYVSGRDFAVADACSFADSVGIDCPRSLNEPITRGAAALASFTAIQTKVKDSSDTLAFSLLSSGAVTAGKLTSAGLASEAKGMTAADIYETCASAVIYLEMFDKDGNDIGTGSAFFIDSNGTAVTCYHLLELAETINAYRSPGGAPLQVLGVYRYDREEDWAVIRVAGGGYPYLRLYSGALKAGAYICTIGSPLGLFNSISDGLIACPDRDVDGSHYIQISAPTSSGSSGGALLDGLGRVIGITSGGFPAGENLNLAVPIRLVDTDTSGRIVPVNSVTPEPELKILHNGAETHEITVGVGETVVLDIYENLIGNVSLTQEYDDLSVIYPHWGDWKDSHTAELHITGLVAGKTTMTITMSSGYFSELATAEIVITVR